MEKGRPHKYRRLTDTMSQGLWNPRYLITIDLYPQPSPHHQLLAARNLLRIHYDTSSGSAMPPAAARLSSDHEDIAGSIEAITKLRNSLPELACYRTVYFDIANNYWVVDVANINPGCYALDLPLKIGRCPVYLCDSKEIYIIHGLYADNFDLINPNRICDDRVSLGVAQAFPYSIGMRVYKWGHVDILFESKKKLRQGIEEGKMPGSIGGLTWGTRILDIEASASNVNIGMQVSATEEDYRNALGCIGLRIRQRGEEKDSWTTTTHAWMNLPPHKLSWSRNMVANVLTLVRRSRFLSTTVDVIRGSEAEGRRSQSVLGTNVFLAGTRTKVGTITKCYDKLPLPDSTIAFPLGLDHDLSLITGNELPTVSMPPNFPKLERRFADPEEALRASDLFLSRFNVQFSRWDTFTGHAVTGSAREALVVGVDYFWKRGHTSVNKALIWRTTIDDHSVAGASGSTLCLGVPSALTCKPVVFQNYESGFQNNKFWAMDEVRSNITGFSARATFKGGFLLPADVYSAEIITEDDPPERRSFSGPEAASPAQPHSMEKRKKNISDST